MDLFRTYLINYLISNVLCWTFEFNFTLKLIPYFLNLVENFIKFFTFKECCVKNQYSFPSGSHFQIQYNFSNFSSSTHGHFSSHDTKLKTQAWGRVDRAQVPILQNLTCLLYFLFC